MPRGGPRPGSGRPKGAVGKLTEEARMLAAPYAKKAFKELAKLAGLVKAEQAASAEAVRVQALQAILDRAYGKPKQPVEGEMLHGMSEELRRFIAGNRESSRAFIGFDGEDQEPQGAIDGGPVSHH